MNQSAEKVVKGLSLRYPQLKTCEKSICAAIEFMTDAFQNGNRLLICGNGGSASDSLHIVGELM